MKIRTVNKGYTSIAVIASDDVLINTAQDALDLMTTVRYHYGCDKMVITAENICKDFFSLQSGIAGEIMQKYINYGMALAIVGEFDQYHSKSLKSLIYESNKRTKIFFKTTESEALEALSAS